MYNSQNNKQKPYVNALEKAHQALVLETNGWEQDAKIAKQLTAYINKVLWPRKFSQVNGGEILTEWLTTQRAAEVRKKLKLSATTSRMGWKELENNIHNILITTLSDLGGEIQFSAKGDAKSSVPVLTEIPKKYKKAVLKATEKRFWSKEFKEEGTLVTIGKDAKPDSLIITGKLQDENLAALSNLSINIKNYDGELRLEEVREDKAFLALINYMSKGRMSPRAISSLWGYFKQNDHSGIAQKHLEHIRNIYALTGMGTQYIKINEQSPTELLDITIFARFLLYRRGGYGSTEGVQILSTKEIIHSMLTSEKPNGFMLVNGITKFNTN